MQKDQQKGQEKDQETMLEEALRYFPILKELFVTYGCHLHKNCTYMPKYSWHLRQRCKHATGIAILFQTGKYVTL